MVSRGSFRKTDVTGEIALSSDLDDTNTSMLFVSGAYSAVIWATLVYG